ncbi:hypothetical protein MUG87_18160 [Ectobacillus sp. JY-23]|uniref:hypothetical protein n=1 Tax=Ectobacillus sp. JY-23 TaxID=2933872 RepID=UPI001FF597F7|nr:hypothetical protein [Ectobacillus sp. JY-23]UOY92328.1 hypothetical protein MUG87_18160 [Ectobacillus sp. JY-23]
MKGASLYLLVIIFLSQVFFAFNYIQKLQVQNYFLWLAVSIIGIFAAGIILKRFRNVSKNGVILSSIVLSSSIGVLGVLGFQYFISNVMG